MTQNDRLKFRVAIFDKMANDEWEFEKFGNVGYYIEESGRLYMLTINQYDVSSIYLNQDFNSPTAGRCFKVVKSTGLKDKNGNLIYEGCVVKWLERKYVINWIDDEACLRAVSIDNEEITTLKLHKHFEVLGNKFENPKLLK